jgi:hypothetical protein
MKHTLSSTLQIRFPEAPVVLHTSYFREDLIIRALFAVCAMLLIAYVTIVGMTIVNVIARKEALDRTSETRSAIAQLEHEYFSRTEALTVSQGAERGLEPVSDKRYVQRLTAVGYAETDAADGI